MATPSKETLQQLDQLLGAAIGLLPMVAKWQLPGTDKEISFEVSSASDQNTQLFSLTNSTLDIRRVIHARKASFPVAFNQETLLGTLLTIEGSLYRITKVEHGEDMVSWRLGLSSPQL